MPRLANLNKQKLAQCELGDYQQYKNLQPVMTDTINWQLIKEQYSQIVKYTAAMKAGHADPESILRRFNQNNLKHPIYMALSQLGKVLKTIFICNYLVHESIRQEIQEGLNVVELWSFDLNDYSVPHDQVRKTLLVKATLDTVSILDGVHVVAHHNRSFDKGAQIESETHIRALA